MVILWVFPFCKHAEHSSEYKATGLQVTPFVPNPVYNQIQSWGFRFIKLMFHIYKSGVLHL